ncbi:Metal tolerance protein B [Glycine soja]|nr:Metal tolerance protein B [Glycine soja]
MEHEKAPILVEERTMQEIEIPIASERLDVLPMKADSSCSSVCPFSGQENSVVASKESSKSAKKLSGLIVFYAIVMVVELIGGIKAHSLAVISDAAHLLSDIAGFSISLFAVWASGWEATPHQSFGYNRLEGAYLHVMADMIQPIGVMIAGAIIWAKPEWFMVDLVCTLLFSVLSLSTTLPMLRNIYGILMERTPSEIDISKLENGLLNIKGVQDVHDLHVWAITVGKCVLSCHVVAEPGISSIDLLGTIKHYCEKKNQIQHVTIQIE